jgi:hypothetical protein
MLCRRSASLIDYARVIGKREQYLFKVLCLLAAAGINYA